MLTSKERINRILALERPDRVGVKDLFWDETQAEWKRGLGQEPEDYFDFDIKVLDIEHELPPGKVESFFSPENADKFLAISFGEPFQRYADTVGLESALEDIARDPNEVAKRFKDDLDAVLSRAIGLLDAGYTFDGLWLFGDLAHRDGLFFSPEFYKKHLFGFHKEICYFFASFGVPSILHSDGNVSAILPQLVNAGFRALHPVQCSAGLDIRQLKREYGNDIAFFGNFDVASLSRSRGRLDDDVREKLDAFKDGGGYIFGFDGPLGPGTRIEDYKHVLSMVREYGKY